MNFAQILDKTMKERNISNYEMSKKTGISDSLIGYWRKGERVPKADNLLNVANFLECSVDYLLGRTNDSTIEQSTIPASEPQNEMTAELIAQFNSLNLADRSRVIVFIDELKRKQVSQS